MSIFTTVYSLFCESHAYTKDENCNIGWSLCFFHGLFLPPTPSAPSILHPSVLQWLHGVTFALHAVCSWASLNIGSPTVAQPPIRNTPFLHLFPRQLTFKGGRLWLLTVCPWPALCLHLKTVWLNWWLFYYFLPEAASKSRCPCMAADCQSMKIKPTSRELFLLGGATLWKKEHWN